MKNNVIWVDFNPRQKKKSKIKNMLLKISQWFKNMFHTSSKNYNASQPVDHFHKSIL